MYFNFGKKKSISNLLPPPELAGTSAFGRYLQYGSRFGRQYFGRRHFGSHMMPDGTMMEGPPCKDAMAFGRRRVRRVKSNLKKPPKALMRMCKKHGIKCTKKVGGKRKYKSISVLKKQLRRKVRRKVRKVRRSRRKVHRRRARFGSKRVSLFGFKF